MVIALVQLIASGIHLIPFIGPPLAAGVDGLGSLVQALVG